MKLYYSLMVLTLSMFSCKGSKEFSKLSVSENPVSIQILFADGVNANVELSAYSQIDIGSIKRNSLSQNKFQFKLNEGDHNVNSLISTLTQIKGVQKVYELDSHSKNKPNNTLIIIELINEDSPMNVLKTYDSLDLKTVHRVNHSQNRFSVETLEHVSNLKNVLQELIANPLISSAKEFGKAENLNTKKKN